MHLLKFLNFLLILMISPSLFATTPAKDMKIINVNRVLAEDNSDFHRKEYYIDAGTKKGLKKDHIVPIIRRASVYSPLSNSNSGDIWLPVGKVKVIHTGEGIAIARRYSTTSKKIYPELEYDEFMIGDRLDFANAVHPSDKKKRKWGKKGSKTSRRGKNKSGSSKSKKNSKSGANSKDPNLNAINWNRPAARTLASALNKERDQKKKNHEAEVERLLRLKSNKTTNSTDIAPPGQQRLKMIDF